MKNLSKTQKQILKISMLVTSILCIVLFIIFRIKTAKATWYNSSWDYRKSVTITYSGAELTDYDVLIEMDTQTLITASKMQSDCDDIRVTDSDKTTLIPYWIEGGCNTTTTQIWARVPSIPDGGKTIYIYYDNTSVVNAEESWTNSFIALSDTTCAAGWARDTAFDSKFPRGAATYGGTGGSSTHTHSVNSGSTSSTGATLADVSDGSVTPSQATHSHSYSGTCTTDDNTPPYLDMIFCGKSKLDIPTNHIALFDVNSFAGWTRFSALDDKFPRGAATYGGTGGATTHTHTLSFSIGTGGTNDTGGNCTSNCKSAADDGHSHSVTNSSSSGTNIPPYLNMVYMKKDSAGTLSTERPIYIMNTSTMPLGWERFATLDSKFPQGAATYGGTGGSSSHSHSGNKTTGGSTKNINVMWPGSRSLQSATHTHSFSWTTTENSHLPPYINAVFAKRKSPVATTSLGAEEQYNHPPATPSLDLPTDTATNQILFPVLKTTTTDYESDYLRYKIELDTVNTFDSGNLQTFDQTSSQTGWSGQNTESSTAYTSGTQAVYTVQTPLSPTTTYYWRSYAIDPDGSNTWSSTQGTPYSFTTTDPPTQPTSLLTEGVTNPAGVTDTTPEFSAICHDPNSDILNKYQIQVDDNSNFSSTLWNSNSSGTSMPNCTSGNRSSNISYAGTTLSLNGTIYYWRIKFWDQGGAEGVWSSEHAFFIMDTRNDGRPSNCRISETIGESSLTLLWNDNSSTETQFRIEKNIDAGGFAFLINKAADSTSHTDSSVSAGRTYQYRVRAEGATNTEWCTTTTVDLSLDNFNFKGLNIKGINIK